LWNDVFSIITITFLFGVGAASLNFTGARFVWCAPQRVLLGAGVCFARAAAKCAKKWR
jgi:hypothetical protein